MPSPFPIARLSNLWPTTGGACPPLICLAGTGPVAVVVLSAKELSWNDAAQLPLGGASSWAEVPAGEGSPFQSGLIGLLSYDLCASAAAGGHAVAPASIKARIFRVHQALIWNSQGPGPHCRVSGAPRRDDSDWSLSDAQIRRLCDGLNAAAEPDESDPNRAAPCDLVAEATDADYRQTALQVLRDIRAGRYYQLNLLRYFKIQSPITHDWVFRRLDAFGGEFSSIFLLPSLEVVSFSPERFLRGWRVDAQCVGLETWPIKGTAPRWPHDPKRDAAVAQALLASRKDLAELHMIVDLMRNDLTRISRPGSVQVPYPQRLISTANVHHLQACVTASAPTSLTLGDLVKALCPAGSITGAPKIEVMGAIREYEGQNRGYFMGHAFYLDDRGHFDASILIRTMVKEGAGPWRFAAGSGLVIGSDPDAEAAEIMAKARVLTAE